MEPFARGTEGEKEATGSLQKGLEQEMWSRSA